MATNDAFFGPLLAKVGAAINDPKADINVVVHDDRLYGRVWRGGRIALGDAYVEGWWDCERLNKLVARFLSEELEKQLPGVDMLTLSLKSWLFNRQKGEKKASEIAQHYDSDPEFYKLFLDQRMTYTCANWDHVHTLDQAQTQKLARTCYVAEITGTRGKRVLDIGCGWGSFMGYAAEKHNAQVTGITVAPHQAAYVNSRYHPLPVVACTRRWEEYRPEEQFDTLVSVGMFEHVGRKNYDPFFATTKEWVKPGGVFLLHTIWTEDEEGKDPWLNKRIFPTGELPRLWDILKATHKKYIVESIENFGPDYSRTLNAWGKNLAANRDKVAALFGPQAGERIYRLYQYYFSCCEGGFEARETNVGRIKLRRMR